VLQFVNFVLKITNFFLVHNVGKGMVREGSFPFFVLFSTLLK